MGRILAWGILAWGGVSFLVGECCECDRPSCRVCAAYQNRKGGQGNLRLAEAP